MSVLDPEVKAKWTAALRSGDYPQTQKSLVFAHETTLYADPGSKNPDLVVPAGYCCLGVLMELYIKDNPGEFKQVEEGDAYTRVNFDDEYFQETGDMQTWCEFPPDEVKGWAMGQYVAFETETWVEDSASMNDAGKSFDEIADWIEDTL